MRGALCITYPRTLDARICILHMGGKRGRAYTPFERLPRPAPVYNLFPESESPSPPHTILPKRRVHPLRVLITLSLRPQAQARCTPSTPSARTSARHAEPRAPRRVSYSRSSITRSVPVPTRPSAHRSTLVGYVRTLTPTLTRTRTRRYTSRTRRRRRGPRTPRTCPCRTCSRS